MAGGRHDVVERPPPGYPAGFETDVVLADGATAHVRPIRPDDGPRILAFHARQSPQSIYFRYFSPRPRLSERDVERMTGVDYVDRMALVALRGDELIGVARYDRWRHRSEAEVAFFVDDANHGRGLATVLLEHLAVRAREVGLAGFTASVLPGEPQDDRRLHPGRVRDGHPLRGRGGRGAARAGAHARGRGRHRGTGARGGVPGGAPAAVAALGRGDRRRAGTRAASATRSSATCSGPGSRAPCGP